MTTSINRCCGATCDVTTGGPHWGDVEVVGCDYDIDENGLGDHTWLHACQGHAEMVGNGKYDPADYVPAPEGCDTVRESDDEMKP